MVEAALLSQRPSVSPGLVLALLQNDIGSHSTDELMAVAEGVAVSLPLIFDVCHYRLCPISLPVAP